jgi:hypothetical protein
MAEEVQIPGAGSTAKVRNIVAVAVLSVVTLGDSPGKSTLALFPGGLVVVPALWTIVMTFKRVQAAQERAGQTPLNGWLGLVLYLVFSPAFFAYMQSGLNSVWTSIAAPAPALPAESPAA